MILTLIKDQTKIKAIDTFVDEIDRVTPQVLVEARIYDITCTDRLDLGVEWNVGRNTTYASTGVGDAGPNPTGGTRDAFVSSLFDGSIGKTNNMDGLIRFGWLNPSIDIDVLVQAQHVVVGTDSSHQLDISGSEFHDHGWIPHRPYEALRRRGVGALLLRAQ